MSHIDGQPLEIPTREVTHDFEYTDTGADYIAGVGKAEQTQTWMTEAELLIWEGELRRREQARAGLGGFGFHV